MNPFASLIEATTDSPPTTANSDDYGSDYENDYGVTYDYYDYDEATEEYEYTLEGFNITMFEESPAVQRVQAAVT